MGDEVEALKVGQLDFDQRFIALEHRARQELGFPAPPTNPFSKSEARHAADLKQVVEVNGQPVTVSR